MAVSSNTVTNSRAHRMRMRWSITPGKIHPSNSMGRIDNAANKAAYVDMLCNFFVFFFPIILSLNHDLHDLLIRRLHADAADVTHTADGVARVILQNARVGGVHLAFHRERVSE